MFWRRSKRSDGAGGGAGAGEELDDIAKLQRQFGIKPVSDADIQSELQTLLGGLPGGADSPTAQLMRLVGGHGDEDEEDEEAKILRELKISGSLSDDDVDVPSDDEAGDREGGAGKEHGNMRRVIAEAQHNHEQQTRAIESGDARGIVSSFSDQKSDGKRAGVTPEQVRELKMRALQLKREGNVPAALAMLREAKQLEASIATPVEAAAPSIAVAIECKSSSSSAVVTTTATAFTITSALKTGSASASALASSRQQACPTSAPVHSEVHYGEAEEVEVQVTDDDMQDPEFLAQLASFGHVEDSDERKAHAGLAARLDALGTQIHELKLSALRLKRENRIQEALACMRSMRELEKQRDDLRETQMAPAPVQVPYMSELAPRTPATIVETSARTAVAVAHGYAAPVSQSDRQLRDDAEDSDIDVTEDDMNDPSFRDELAKLGFKEDDTPVSTASQPSASRTSSLHATNALSRHTPRLYTVDSFDEDGLIDEFESDSEGDGGDVENDKKATGQPVEKALPAPIGDASTVPASHSPGEWTFADLQSQLDRARRTALQFKRDGKLSDALEHLRRAKQIEKLIQLKQATGSSNSAPAPTPAVQQDPAVAMKFQELEGLLVEFGNRATASAKENLSTDRAAAAAWLAKRKEYAVHLDTLRVKRHNPLQLPPPFRVSKTSRQVEFELQHVPDDCIRVAIRSVNGLPLVAGSDVYVQFSLSFPASAPHEAKTEPIRIQPDAQHSSGRLVPSKAFQFKLQRTRGTLRLFEIKKASFEVWRPGTLFRNPEMIARGYQALSPLLSRCEVSCRVPFVGSSRKPTGGDIEIALQLRRPLRDKEIREEVVDELVIGDYPEPICVVPTEPLPQMPTTTQRSSPAPTTCIHAPEEKPVESNGSVAGEGPDELDPFDLDLIVSYDVINEELDKIEAKLPSLGGMQASELRDRLDSLALKKQLLEIEMQTGKLTLKMYTTRLHARIVDDRALMASLMRLGRRSDAARVLRRVKVMEKELEGAEDGEQEEEGVEF